MVYICGERRRIRLQYCCNKRGRRIDFETVYPLHATGWKFAKSSDRLYGCRSKRQKMYAVGGGRTTMVSSNKYINRITIVMQTFLLRKHNDN